MTAHGERPTYVLRTLDLFAEYGDREAIVGVGWDCRLTYAQARAMVLEMAAEMRDAGLRPGMTVAVLVAHPPEAPLLQLALHLLGCRTAWIAAGSGRRATAGFLERVRPEALIYDTRTHAEYFGELASGLGVPLLCLGSDGLGPNLLAPRPAGAEPFDPDTAVGAPETIFQTSGTTGEPKLIHHRAALYEQMSTLAEEWVAAGEPLLRHLTITPLWYVAGQTSALLNLVSGGVLYVMYYFRPGEFLATIEKYRATSVYITPPQFYELLDDPAVTTADCGSLQLLSVGGASVNPARLREGIRRFGPVIRITYGLSETPFISAFPNIAEDPAHPGRIGSCGTPYGDVRVQIRDEDGAVLPTGRTGEIWIASKLNFAGYWGQPELTEQTLMNGWVRTRDLAYADEDGYLHIVGRAQDMIITGRGSDNIFPRPIEEALTSHPGVRAAAVIGVPHATLGEAAHAYVVPADKATVTVEELSELVAERLTKIWVPHGFDFVDDLPHTPSGKVNVKALKDSWATAHETAAIG